MFMPILGLLPLLGLKRQDEEEMTFIKKKEILYRKWNEASFDLS